MTRISVKNLADESRLVKNLQARQKPYSVEIKQGVGRSISQNRLQRLWLREAEEQGDQTAEEYRSFCKLHFGVPILVSENERFAEQYEILQANLNYEQLLELMKIPMDFPVTRLMSAKQKKRYLDEIYQHFTSIGIQLSNPDWQGMDFGEGAA